jgi:DNA-3-methyladenine glycosylase I
MAKNRCEWANNSLFMLEYHDKEWGIPVHDDKKLFEFLILEGAQAGLMWETVLKKRENYRKAFDDFNPSKISLYSTVDVKRLLTDSGIIRNRLKVKAAISNAQRFLDIQKEFGSFDKYIWSFVGGKPIKNRFRSLSELPAKTLESDAMSKDLRKRGFKFVGSIICYAFMQAVGMVNDHTTDCFKFNEI